MQNINSTPSTVRGGLVAMGALALVLGLSGCNKQDDGRTAGQKLDSAVAKTEQAATDLKNDAKTAMNTAENKLEGSGPGIKADAKDAANTVANTVDDVAITASVSAALVKDPDLSAIKINVDTKNGAVSLSGPAPSAAAKERATSIAQGVKGVTSVTNNLMAPAG